MAFLCNENSHVLNIICQLLLLEDVSSTPRNLKTDTSVRILVIGRPELEEWHDLNKKPLTN